MLHRSLVATIAAIAACSSSCGDGIEPDPSGASTTTGSAAAASSAQGGAGGSSGSSAASGTGGDGGGSTASANKTVRFAWTFLQGEFDSADQMPEGEGFPGRRMVACAVDAPEIGQHVVYVERSGLETPDEPD